MKYAVLFILSYCFTLSDALAQSITGSYISEDDVEGWKFSLDIFDDGRFALQSSIFFGHQGFGNTLGMGYYQFSEDSLLLNSFNPDVSLVMKITDNGGFRITRGYNFLKNIELYYRSDVPYIQDEEFEIHRRHAAERDSAVAVIERDAYTTRSGKFLPGVYSWSYSLYFSDTAYQCYWWGNILVSSGTWRQIGRYLFLDDADLKGNFILEIMDKQRLRSISLLTSMGENLIRKNDEPIGPVLSEVVMPHRSSVD